MRRPKSFARELLDTSWQQPLWAVPFAIFFTELYAPDWRGFPLMYRMSLVFAYAIRLAMVLAGHLLLPRLAPRREAAATPDRLWFWVDGLVYASAAIVGAFIAAALVNRFVFPGFLGTGRAWVTTGLYTLLFTTLFTGMAYAAAFHRQAVERARAVEQVRAELAGAELRALRAQIQPHFLFNTLNTIAALVAENPRAAEDTVTRLAEVFRHVLAASDEERTPLDAELGFVRDVLAIERLRLGERLRVVENVEPGLGGVPVPSLLLQPIVDNAVRHGIGARAEGGEIRLAAHARDGRLVLEVADDGPGMDAASPSRGAGFGLRSVRERLAALGPPHALELESMPGRGTTVRITLPLEAGPSPARGGTRS
ncbi:MAG TPA: histidine kinase [Terriglobales bacterium]|nr:histidine kinase [Terriglobales bacterium]